MTLDRGTDGYASGYLDLDGGKEAISLSGMCWLISSIFFRIEMVEKPLGNCWRREWTWGSPQTGGCSFF